LIRLGVWELWSCGIGNSAVSVPPGKEFDMNLSFAARYRVRQIAFAAAVNLAALAALAIVNLS